MSWLHNLFSGSSDVSAMRVMSMISLAAGIAIAIIGLYKGRDLSQLSVLSGVFVGSAFGGKAVQKFAEKQE